MNNYSKSIIALSTFFLFGCDGDDAEFPQTLKVTDFEYSDVRLFSKQGEIKDQKVINDFIQRELKEKIIIDTNTQLQNFKHLNITFDSSRKAFFDNDKSMEFSVKKDKKTFSFYSTDYYNSYSFEPLKYMGEIHNSDTYEMDDILVYLGPQNPNGEVKPQWPSIFNQHVISCRKTLIIGNGSYNNLQFNLFNFTYKITKKEDPDYYASISNFYIYNEFNEKNVSKLKTEDTIAIQKYRVTMKKVD